MRPTFKSAPVGSARPHVRRSVLFSLRLRNPNPLRSELIALDPGWCGVLGPAIQPGTRSHPFADEYEAFKELHEQCGSVELVAAFFAVPPRTVEQRLRLTNASPKLFQLYRDGGIEIDQLMALCLTDDHELQERVWKNGERNHWMRDADQLRRALTQGKISLSGDRIARFVSAQAYIDAGGHVMRDLFSPNADDGFITDAALLQRLAVEGLDVVAAATRAEGWPWVEVHPVFDYAEQSRYGRCDVRKRKPTEAEAGEQARVEKRQKDVQSAREVGKLDAIEAARITVDATARPFAGAVVSVDQSGAVQVQRGLIKPEDRKALAKAQKAKEREKHKKAGEARAVGTEGVDPGADAPEPRRAEKLRRATPHWTRHTHATHLLEGGAELTTVRHNLRHASLATTSMYLHADDARRAKQVTDRFAAPRA